MQKYIIACKTAEINSYFSFFSKNRIQERHSGKNIREVR